MRTLTWTVLISAALLFATSSHAKSAKDVLEEAWEMQVQRWDGLDSYLIEQSVMGNRSKLYYVRTSVAEAGGGRRTMFLPAFTTDLRNGCVDPISSATSSSEESNDGARHMSWFIDNAELIGEDSVGDHKALQFRADGLDETQPMNGREITMKAMNMWLRKGDYLPLKTRMEGIATIEGQSRPITVDTINSDFRLVTGSQLKEPFQRVTMISGVMGAVDPEQIARAQKQMAQFEKKMANMPASQRAMMEKMMGPRMEAMRKMSQTGGIETEIRVNSITLNPEVNGKRVVACQ